MIVLLNLLYGFCWMLACWLWGLGGFISGTGYIYLMNALFYCTWELMGKEVGFIKDGQHFERMLTIYLTSIESQELII